jgi:hypothetical protein
MHDALTDMHATNAGLSKIGSPALLIMPAEPA